MKKFPKTLYVTAKIGTDYDDDDEIVETVFGHEAQDDLQVILDVEDEDTEVAVYQLVKVGTIKQTRKLSFAKE